MVYFWLDSSFPYLVFLVLMANPETFGIQVGKISGDVKLVTRVSTIIKSVLPECYVGDTLCRPKVLFWSNRREQCDYALDLGGPVINLGA